MGEGLTFQTVDDNRVERISFDVCAAEKDSVVFGYLENVGEVALGGYVFDECETGFAIEQLYGIVVIPVA